VISTNSVLQIHSASGDAGVDPGDTLIFEGAQIKRKHGGTESVWASSYSIQGNEVTGVTNGKDFRLWLDSSSQLSNSAQWSCDLFESSPSTGRRIARAVAIGTFLGALAGSLAGLAAHAPLLGALVGLAAALTSALSTGMALDHSNDRLTTSGGFVAEEGEGGPITMPPGQPSTNIPILRVAGRR
jgi:hypothetical protein